MGCRRNGISLVRKIAWPSLVSDLKSLQKAYATTFYILSIRMLLIHVFSSQNMLSHLELQFCLLPLLPVFLLKKSTKVIEYETSCKIIMRYFADDAFSKRGISKQSSMKKSGSKSRKMVRFSQDLDDLEPNSANKANASNESQTASSNSSAFIQPPNCQPLKEFFWVLESMLSLKGGRRNSKLAQENWDRQDLDLSPRMKPSNFYRRL